MNSLVKIVNEVALIEQKLIESEGQVTPEIEALLLVNAELLPDKIDSYSHIMERFEAISDYYENRSLFFAKAASRCEQAKERLKENIKLAMKTLNVDELSGQDVRFKLQPVKSRVVIEDDSLIPKDYKKEVIKYEIKKERLRGDLEIGPVPGAKLEKSYSLKTYAATPAKKGKKNE